MNKNVKKVVASAMATITVLSTMASTCFAAGNGRIGVKYYYFNWGMKKVYVGDVNADGVINVQDYWDLVSVGDLGIAFWNAEKVYDCNGDGYVNSKDADALLDYCVGH